MTVLRTPLEVVNLVLTYCIKFEDVFMFPQYPLRSFFDNFRINNERLFHIEKKSWFSVLQQVSACAVATSQEVCVCVCVFELTTVVIILALLRATLFEGSSILTFSHPGCCRSPENKDGNQRMFASWHKQKAQRL